MTWSVSCLVNPIRRMPPGVPDEGCGTSDEGARPWRPHSIRIVPGRASRYLRVFCVFALQICRRWPGTGASNGAPGTRNFRVCGISPRHGHTGLRGGKQMQARGNEIDFGNGRVVSARASTYSRSVEQLLRLIRHLFAGSSHTLVATAEIMSGGVAHRIWPPRGRLCHLHWT
jgi:hypothetical protein